MRRLALGLFAAAVFLGACSGKTTTTVSSSPTPVPSEPKTAEELKAIAQLHFNSFSSGDFGAFWDDLDSGSKAVVTRDEYVRRLQACMRNDPNKSSPLIVQTASENKDATWSVTVRYVKYNITFPAIYESGHWRFVLSPNVRKAMTMPFNQYLATQCHR